MCVVYVASPTYKIIVVKFNMIVGTCMFVLRISLLVCLCVFVYRLVDVRLWTIQTIATLTRN